MRYFVIIFFLISCTKKNDLKTYYPHLKWAETFKGETVVVDKEFQNKTTSGMSLGFEGKLKHHVLQSEMIVEVDPEFAQNLMKNKTALIKGLYANCPSSANVDVAIQDKKNQITLQFDLTATARFVTGVCEEDQNTFKNQTLLIYCKNIKTFYELKYFYPKNEKILKSPIASCY